MTRINLEKETENARKELSDFCITDCRAECYSNGNEIDLSEKQASLMFRKNNIYDISDERFGIGIHQSGETGFIMYTTPCPRLQRTEEGKYLCQIHTHPQRPKQCKEYPIKIENGSVLISNSCKGKQNGLLDAYIKKLEEEKIKISYTK